MASTTDMTNTPQQSRLTALVLGTGVVIGLHLGLLHLFLWKNPWAVLLFLVGSLSYSAISWVLCSWVFPRLPGRSFVARLTWQTSVAMAIFFVHSIVVMSLGGAFLGLPHMFGPAVGPDQVITVTAEGRQFGLRVYTLLPLVPSVMLSLILYHQVWRRVHKLQDRAREMSELAAAAQLAALRAQINPHFLFNSLNSIAQLIHVDPDKAETCVERLAEIFRYLLRRSEQEFVPLAEELAVAEAYLEIERARFGERLRVETTVDADTLRRRIPSLILQPLVENAVKHGLSRKIGAGTVRIGARIDGPILTLTVGDDGVGMARQALDDVYDRGVGLRNLRARLERLYGPEYLPEIESGVGTGTSIRLRLPLEAAA